MESPEVVDFARVITAFRRNADTVIWRTWGRKPSVSSRAANPEKRTLTPSSRFGSFRPRGRDDRPLSAAIYKIRSPIHHGAERQESRRRPPRRHRAQGDPRMTDRPIRIQLRRIKGWRMPENTVRVDATQQVGQSIYRLGKENHSQQARQRLLHCGADRRGCRGVLPHEAHRTPSRHCRGGQTRTARQEPCVLLSSAGTRRA